MKRLLLFAGVAMLATLVVSCGAGYLVGNAGNHGAVAALRNLSIMFLSLFWLITTLLVGAIGFAGTWALGRWGGKGVSGLAWVKGKTLWVESKVEHGIEAAVVRPIGKTARALTTGKVLISASMEGGERAAALDRQREAALRTVSSLVHQLRNNPLGQAEH